VSPGAHNLAVEDHPGSVVTGDAEITRVTLELLPKGRIQVMKGQVEIAAQPDAYRSSNRELEKD
jgi:hypothetical protein